MKKVISRILAALFGVFLVWYLGDPILSIIIIIPSFIILQAIINKISKVN